MVAVLNCVGTTVCWGEVLKMALKTSANSAARKKKSPSPIKNTDTFDEVNYPSAALNLANRQIKQSKQRTHISFKK